MELGDRHLKVQRAAVGFAQASGLEMSVGAMSMLAGTTDEKLEESRVLQLLNMVTAEELIDNEDYQGMLVHDGCNATILTTSDRNC
jgi:splicing factor U2AF subunit